MVAMGAPDDGRDATAKPGSTPRAMIVELRTGSVSVEEPEVVIACSAIASTASVGVARIRLSATVTLVGVGFEDSYTVRPPLRPSTTLRRRFTLESLSCEAYVPCTLTPVAFTVEPPATRRPTPEPLAAPVTVALVRLAVSPTPAR
jgi:hypothetical protein